MVSGILSLFPPFVGLHTIKPILEITSSEIYISHQHSRHISIVTPARIIVKTKVKIPYRSQIKLVVALLFIKIYAVEEVGIGTYFIRKIPAHERSRVHILPVTLLRVIIVAACQSFLKLAHMVTYIIILTLIDYIRLRTMHSYVIAIDRRFEIGLAGIGIAVYLTEITARDICGCRNRLFLFIYFHTVLMNLHLVGNLIIALEIAVKIQVNKTSRRDKRQAKQSTHIIGQTIAKQQLFTAIRQ